MFLEAFSTFRPWRAYLYIGFPLTLSAEYMGGFCLPLPRNDKSICFVSSLLQVTGLESIFSPSASSVSVCIPRVTSAAYDLWLSNNKEENLVPRLIARISRPVAIGSNVPRWPTFLN